MPFPTDQGEEDGASGRVDLEHLRGGAFHFQQVKDGEGGAVWALRGRGGEIEMYLCTSADECER